MKYFRIIYYYLSTFCGDVLDIDIPFAAVNLIYQDLIKLSNNGLNVLNHHRLDLLAFKDLYSL